MSGHGLGMSPDFTTTTAGPRCSIPLRRTDSKSLGTRNLLGPSAEAAGERNKVGIRQGAGDRPIMPKPFLLNSADVAVGPVVVQHDRDGDVELHRGGQLGGRERNPPSPTSATTGRSGAAT